jgi:hypothetical protein
MQTNKTLVKFRVAKLPEHGSGRVYMFTNVDYTIQRLRAMIDMYVFPYRACSECLWLFTSVGQNHIEVISCKTNPRLCLKECRVHVNPVSTLYSLSFTRAKALSTKGDGFSCDFATTHPELTFKLFLSATSVASTLPPVNPCAYM